MVVSRGVIRSNGRKKPGRMRPESWLSRKQLRALVVGTRGGEEIRVRRRQSNGTLPDGPAAVRDVDGKQSEDANSCSPREL